jgi:6-pyruvoyltetrahydropterin/6-carboxytetrahydropterin synthase
MGFTSEKVFDGYSTCFRQWKAEGTHCKFLHGYGVSFKVWFEGELDERNWVWDFGGMKRAKTQIEGKNPKEYFDWLLDHTVIVAKDDPSLPLFEKMDHLGIIQLRVLSHVGAEQFAKFLFDTLNNFCFKETAGRVSVKRVEFREHEKNSASYERPELGTMRYK